jgi:hypothetical protein
MGHKGSMVHKNKAAAYMMDGAAEDQSALPNLNKGYGYESPGKQRSNLMNDNPIVSRAGTFMTQHSQSRISGSPLMQKGTKPDIIDADGDGNKKELMVDALKQKNS